MLPKKRRRSPRNPPSKTIKRQIYSPTRAATIQAIRVIAAFAHTRNQLPPKLRKRVEAEVERAHARAHARAWRPLRSDAAPTDRHSPPITPRLDVESVVTDSVSGRAR